MSYDTFEAWMKRPVYVAQCTSWKKAHELDVTCVLFRALPRYRDIEARRARKAVADALRAERKSRASAKSA